MGTATSTGPRTAHGAAQRAAGGVAGTACRTGRTTCGLLSCCANRGAASAHGRAAESERQTLTTSSRTTETGNALPTRAICKACATAATAQRPWQKAGLKAERCGADRRNARTGADRRVGANLARNLKISRRPPRPRKVLRRGALDRSPPFMRDFFPMEREFWRF